MGPTRPGGASNSTSDVGTGMGTAYDMQGPTSPGSLSSSAPIGAADGVDRSRCSAAGATGDSTRGADDSRALGGGSPLRQKMLRPYRAPVVRTMRTAPTR